MTKTEVATISKTGTILTDINPQLLDVMSPDDEFDEALSGSDLLIPRIKLLQSTNPETKDGHPKQVDGAKPGWFFNNITNEVIDGIKVGLKFVSIHYTVEFIEWTSRKSSAKGGQFVASHDEISYNRIIKNKVEGEDVIASSSPVGTPGNVVVMTHNHFILVLKNDGTFYPAIMSIAQTGIKHSKRLNSLISQKRNPTNPSKIAPRYFGLYQVMSKLEENSKGSWYSPIFYDIGGNMGVFSLPGTIGADLYNQAKSMRDKFMGISTANLIDIDDSLSGDRIESKPPLNRSNQTTVETLAHDDIPF